jgi:hypothetical protein
MINNMEDTVTKPLVPTGQLLRSNDWSIPAAWAMCAFGVFAGLFFILVSPSPGSEFDGPLRPVLGLAWIGFGIMSVNKVRAGVIVEKEGIVVRSRIRSDRYQWSEINEFKWQPSLIRKTLQIHLKDGRCIYAHGFSVRSPDEAQRAKEMVAELNRLASDRSVE